MEHLIADSGIHFISREIEFNPSEPLILNNGRTLKYTFYDGIDFLEGTRIFDLMYYHNEEGKYIPLGELQTADRAIVRRPNGREELDESGLPVMTPGYPTTLFTTYNDDDEDLISINSLQSFRVKDPADSRTQVAAFDLLLDKWLPMPMFYKEVDGITSNLPLGWCRMKMTKIGEGDKKGVCKYRLVWAFDTQLGEDELSILRPYINREESDSVEFCLCNKADLFMDFLSSSEDFHAFSVYIATLLGIDTTQDESRRYKAFYIYFCNFIRLIGAAPEVTLHDKDNSQDIFVDLVIDIGNSRTCGILFEEGVFTKGKMLALRDLTMPWIEYENKTFDMRVVFRKCDFGNDIVLNEDMFTWKSFVRVGQEARHLLYRSLEEEGISEKNTNYSSPKRYLWDKKEYEGQWENLVTTYDPYNVRLAKKIYVPGLSDYFEDNGTYNSEGVAKDGGELLDLEGKNCHYSRSSLMTFAFIEIFQHAISQINSVNYRNHHGDKDRRRFIRNVIISCPTAMPLKEQITLRQNACDAFDALTHCMPRLRMANIMPTPKALTTKDPYADPSKRTWAYDEASCCQLVYLYAEIAERYGGEIHKFFDLKGHVRPEMKAEGYEGNALTVGTIDIGAGTTDVMVCAYQCEGEGRTRIVPTPLFWDSFYLAGDEILRNLIQNLVIEGKEHGTVELGNISSALTTRILAMDDEQLLAMPCLGNVVYREKAKEIARTTEEEEKAEQKKHFASVLIHDFFGNDSSMMGYRDRRCRTDFNTQISMPIAQKMMDLLRMRRPSRQYSFDEIFSDIRPADYLLDYFEHHFGFRLEELNWRYDPDEVAGIVRSTLEPLMKQLALVLYTQHCDIIVLAGRPTSLDAITELFIKYVPTPPDRLVRLNGYRVGNWFPTADGEGYFYDQKAIVAVGAMVGYLASHTGLDKLAIDFNAMIDKMKSTANYMGVYNSENQRVERTELSPEDSSATLTFDSFPAFIGCRQLDSNIYQARPIHAIYNYSGRHTLTITLSRNFHDSREDIFIEEVADEEGNSLPKNKVELIQQSLVDDGKYWLDKGEFEKLSIK